MANGKAWHAIYRSDTGMFIHIGENKFGFHRSLFTHTLKLLYEMDKFTPKTPSVAGATQTPIDRLDYNFLRVRSRVTAATASSSWAS